MADHWRTPTKRIVRKASRTPRPPRVRRMPTHRTPEIPTSSFYAPVRTHTTTHRPSSPALPSDGGEDTSVESNTESTGSCIECGAAVSDHAQLCGKTYCMNELPWTPPPKAEEPKEEEEAEEPELSPTPVIDWRPRTIKYPHSRDGMPLHDLVACMLRIDRESCVRLYGYTD